MNPKTKLLLLLIVTMLMAPSVAAAKKKSYGNSELPRVFTKSKKLPGPIDVEFSLVTLAKYKNDVDKVFDYTFSETERIAKLFYSGDQNSDLSQIEASAGVSPVTVSKETIVIAEHAKEIAEWTRGAFDPVVGDGSYKHLKINKAASTIFLKKPGLKLDLNGILEGYMADLFIRAAHYANLDDAFVKVNGIGRAMGRAPYGPWQVTVTNAGGSDAHHGLRVTLLNYSAATVGGGFSKPALSRWTGKPVETDFASVTVITKQAATAQGVANAIYTLGKNAGEDLINQLGIRAVFAFSDNRLEKVGSW